MLATNMREEQSAPLANLSAVNYGNLPSRLSAFAAGLPFVSKSKAGICNIGTFPFPTRAASHKRLATDDIYSALRPAPLLQTTHTHTNKQTGSHKHMHAHAPSQTNILGSHNHKQTRTPAHTHTHARTHPHTHTHTQTVSLHTAKTNITGPTKAQMVSVFTLSQQ